MGEFLIMVEVDVAWGCFLEKGGRGSLVSAFCFLRNKKFTRIKYKHKISLVKCLLVRLKPIQVKHLSVLSSWVVA
jgi:hypothetical protein